jgi:hypothetical protein
MKSFLEYLNESEYAANNPVTGDSFSINIREECLVESYVIDTVVDGVVLYADESMVNLLEEYGLLDEDFGDVEKEIGLDAEQDALDPIHAVDEADYQGRNVPLNKPMQGDVKKSKVYVKNPSTGNVVKVNFGDPDMTIKKSNPARRRSFRARHHCENPGPKTKARYWSCRAW